MKYLSGKSVNIKIVLCHMLAFHSSMLVDYYFQEIYLTWAKRRRKTKTDSLPCFNPLLDCSVVGWNPT